MRILVTNDDGAGAHGLSVLHQIAKSLSDDVWIVAPEMNQSGASHALTLQVPLRYREIGERAYAVRGTPADCVRLGLHQFASESTWVLAGINHGGNLGADVHHSGTVAAVREAALHGIPGIAVSHYQKRGLEIDWQRAARWTAPVVAELLAREHQPGTFWNINLPHLDPDAPDPEVVFCALDSSPLPVAYREENGSLHYCGNYHERPRKPGSDVDVCFQGRIAVSRLTV